MEPDPAWCLEDWGRTGYRAALARQLEVLGERRRGERPDTLCLTEHDPVYTIGQRRGAEQHLLADRDTLRARGIEVVATNRGGDITYHGPGQLTGYLIIDLSASRDLHRLLRRVEECLLAVCADCGLEASTREGLTGIWIDKRKIAAIGMGARHWISFHGFALNWDPDLSAFGGIVPCGITDGTVTSLRAERADTPAWEDLKTLVAARFREWFAPGPAAGPGGEPATGGISRS